MNGRLQHYANQELPDIQAGFRKHRETRDQTVNICWIIEKVRKFQKNIYLSFMNYVKTFDLWIITFCGKFLKRWKYQIIIPISWETCMWVKKQQLEPSLEQLIGLGLRKENDRSVCCHPVYLTCMLSNAGLDNLQAEIRIGGRNINNLRHPNDTPLMAERRGTKEPLDEWGWRRRVKEPA